MWRTELENWRAKLNRERGGPVRLRIEAIEEIDEALKFLEDARRRGALDPGAEWGAFKN